MRFFGPFGSIAHGERTYSPGPDGSFDLPLPWDALVALFGEGVISRESPAKAEPEVPAEAPAEQATQEAPQGRRKRGR